MKAFAKPEIIIMGGYSRDINFEPLAREIKELSNIKKILLSGQTQKSLVEAFEEASFHDYEIMGESDDFSIIVPKAYALAEPGDIIILCPAAPSFDKFVNYADRGTHYKQEVMKLA
jgi:UDP-N-acetylmuramoylalanine--D-glutamate ligase